MNSKRHPPRPPVQSVTTAPTSLRDDQSERMHRYLFSMGVRTLCFVLAVVFIAVLDWNVAGWICCGLAVVLPYVAVVMANATGARRIDQLGSVDRSGNPVEQLNTHPHREPRTHP